MTYPNNYYAPFYQAPVNYAPNNFARQENVMQPNVAQNQQSDGMIWVLGKNEAESYPVAPNCQVILWDKNAPTIYVKSMSANNVPNLRVLDFTERTETAQNATKNDFNVDVDKLATKDDITALKGEFDRLAARCERLELLHGEKDEKAPKNDRKLKGSDE